MFQRKAALMVQSDMTIWMNSEHPEEETIRRTLSGFAELIKSPGTWHTYHMTPVTLWNAAAANFTGEKVLTFLSDYSAYPLPDGVKKGIIQAFERYGTLHLF